MSNHHSALVVTEIGRPVVKVSLPTPSPDSGEILVKVHIAGLHAHDAKARDNGLFIASFLPHALASDVVGSVIAVGHGVTKFKEGDRVVAQAGMSGTQEYVILMSGGAAKVPDKFSDEQLATLPTNLITSVVALFDSSALGLPAPWTEESKHFDYAATAVLIVGGGSNVGKFAIQLAHWAGIGEIIVVASAKGEKELASYGATHIIDRHATPEELVSRIRAIVGDDLIYAVDTINPGPEQYMAINALSHSKRGKLARTLPSKPIDETKVSNEKKKGYEVLNILGSIMAHPDQSVPFWERVPQYLEDGIIKPLDTFQTIKGLDVDAVNEKLDGYAIGTLTGQVQMDLRG